MHQISGNAADTVALLPVFSSRCLQQTFGDQQKSPGLCPCPASPGMLSLSTVSGQSRNGQQCQAEYTGRHLTRRGVYCMRQSGQPRRWPSPQFLNVSMTISDNTANVRQHTSQPCKAFAPQRHALRGSRLCTFSTYSFFLFFYFFSFFHPRGEGGLAP